MRKIANCPVGLLFCYVWDPIRILFRSDLDAFEHFDPLYAPSRIPFWTSFCTLSGTFFDPSWIRLGSKLDPFGSTLHMPLSLAAVSAACQSAPAAPSHVIYNDSALSGLALTRPGEVRQTVRPLGSSLDPLGSELLECSVLQYASLDPLGSKPPECCVL